MLASKQFIGSIFIIVGVGFILSSPILLDASLSSRVTPQLVEEEIYSFATATPLVMILEDERDEEDVSLDNSIEEISEIDDEDIVVHKKERRLNSSEVPMVPFYSQFNDITPSSWKKIGCGIASLAMLIEYYEPGTVVVDTLLEEAIDAKAYLDSAGWIHSGLINVSKKYNLQGEVHDYGNLSMGDAYENLRTALKDGPVMASVHYTFQKTNPIPHLVIVNGVENGEVFYNDPAEESGGGVISVAQFQSAWKKRYIEFRPM